VETNPNVQEKGLHLVIKTLSLESTGDSLNIESMVKNLVEKIMPQNKPNLKGPSHDLLLRLYELGNPEEIGSLIEGLCLNKNIKIGTCAVAALSIILNGFGPRDLKPSG
jgi:hypothetical protein